MDMIGHRNKSVGLHAGVERWYFIPYGLDYPPGIIQPHFAVHHLAKQTRPVLRAKGDKIRPGLGVIVPLQPNAAAAVAGSCKNGRHSPLRPKSRRCGYRRQMYQTLQTGINSSLCTSRAAKP